jgi:putative integral membrane protein (TIGR02587 family)
LCTSEDVQGLRGVNDGILGADGAFLVALARAFAGAVLFGLPMFYTMELWSIGSQVDPLRLALFVLASVPLLTGLAWYSGFREDVSWADAVLDAFVAFLIAAVAATSLLLLIGVIQHDNSWRDAIGKIAVQLVPAGIGATIARSQLGAQEEQKDEDARRDSTLGELFLMVAGALFVGFNIAPTDEILVIAHQVSYLHAILLVLATLLGMHALVYGLRFRGQHQQREGVDTVSEFISLTVTGYVLALLVCGAVLWMLGRLDGAAWQPALVMVVVLGLPAGLGAATARVAL